MGNHTDVFISSTSQDLTEYREVAIHVCQRLGMFPLAMEDFGPDPAKAVEVCRRKIEKAEIYLGIFAHRYGWQPDGYGGKSITQLEYEWAIERKIPVYIFMIDDDSSWPAKSVDRGEDAKKLDAFKTYLKENHVVNFFTDNLEKFREDLFVHLPRMVGKPGEMHYVSDIPAPPHPYIAHPYALLQTKHLIGRQQELDRLTEWVADPHSPLNQVTIMNVVAIGGMGKSALTWKWFNDIAPSAMRPLEGRMWWSFYESDARFENFVIRTLSYVSGIPVRQLIEEMSSSQRDEMLLRILDQKPFLIVMDGLERILTAYARMDAAHLLDEDLDEKTANAVAGAMSVPSNAVQNFVAQHRLRKTADPRAGTFLRRLATVQASRVLVSTRLYPSELQSVTGFPMPGCEALFLGGLEDQDALKLWRAMGVTGSDDALRELFRLFDNYPLLIRALAGEVANYRRAPGDFDRWRADNPDFDPTSLPLIQVKSHILSFAIQDLSSVARRVLNLIAALRAPTDYQTLLRLLVAAKPDEPVSDIVRAKKKEEAPRIGIFKSENELDDVLSELEDRGLLGWEKQSNRYDLHPIVRSVTWSKLDEAGKEDAFTLLNDHFSALPEQKIDVSPEVTLDDLAPKIEYYYSLLGLKRFDAAYKYFETELAYDSFYRLSALQQQIEWLEVFFPQGTSRASLLIGETAWDALNDLALAYSASGQPKLALSIYRRLVEYERNAQYTSQDARNFNFGVAKRNLSTALWMTGHLKEANAASACFRASDTRGSEAGQIACLCLNALILAFTGNAKGASKELATADGLSRYTSPHTHMLTAAAQAEVALQFGKLEQAQSSADEAWRLAGFSTYTRDFVTAARLQGITALRAGEVHQAEERLLYAQQRAHEVSFAYEELHALIGLIELAYQRRELHRALTMFDDIWELAERGPFPLLAADAYNLQAQIERDLGSRKAAVKSAQEAYRLAWCDSPPHCYKNALNRAKEHLGALGAKTPAV